MERIELSGRRRLAGGINQIDHKELVEVIVRTWQVKGAVYIEGGIGIGKSESAREGGKQLAKKLKLEYIETKAPNQHPDKFCLVDIRLAQKDAGEVLGLPENYALIKKEDGKYDILPVRALDIFIKNNTDNGKEIEIKDYITRWNPPAWFPRSGYGLIFCDEMSLAPPLVQNCIWELINDRALGDYTLNHIHF